MKVKLICVGKIKNNNIFELMKDYFVKINFDAKFEVVEIRDSTVEEEGKKIIEIIDRIKYYVYVIVLSEEGKYLGSVEFSETLKKIDLSGKTIILVIGGPYGLSTEVKKKADFLLSLSKMTLTHEMSRLFLSEQIYRAISIIKNRNYHKK